MRLVWPAIRSSIFSKLALAFLVVITPLYLLGAFINDGGAKAVDREISQSLKQQVQFYLMSLETEIERMTVLQREFMNDEDLESLSMMVERMTLYERLSAMKRLQTRLGLIKASSAYIAEARAYIPSVSRVISSVMMVDQLDQVSLDGLKADILQAEPPFVAKDGRLYLREYYPSPYNLETRNPNFILELEVSIPELHRFLEQLPGYSTGGAMMIHDDTVIASERRTASSDLIREQLSQLLPASEPAAEDQPPDAGARIERLTMQGERYMIVHLSSDLLNTHLIAYVPEREVMGPIEQYRTYMWLISALALMVIIVFAYWIYRIIHRPLRKLVGAFRKVEAGMMQTHIAHHSNDEFHYLYEKFNGMVAHLNKLIYEVYEHRIHLQHSELKQLQSQINPHFLYNSFYLLYRMTKAHDVDNASRFTKFLGDYYQYITRSGKEEVPLGEELNHVRSYTEIQSIRSGGRIRVEIGEIPEAFGDVTVPRLILQPIVENAYQHGFDTELDDCRLEIGMRGSESPEGRRLLHIEVRDNGVGMTESMLEAWARTFASEASAEEVTGMLNVHRRLRIRYGEDGGVTLAANRPAGLLVILTIPLAIGEAGEV
ncbi:sensor histidine kinase [Paenibacillus sp. 1P07SE]|uniref:sensor histidine kinase n=1 Tax=Paenibacillus sp. 1P07SE TaxID=3132209 RepID=UPI0039A5C82A